MSFITVPAILAEKMDYIFDFNFIPYLIISIGECKLENMRTLCVACHYDVTAAQCAERSKARANAKKKLKELMGSIKNGVKFSVITNIKVLFLVIR